MQALLASARRECRFLRASPWDLALATWIPCLILLIVAWMFSSGVPRELPVAVVDLDRSTTSRELIRHLQASPGLTVSEQPATLEQAFSLARALKVYAVVHIPAGTGRDIQRDGSATVLSYFNASYQVAGQAAARDIDSAVQAVSAQLAVTEIALTRGPASVRAAPIAVQTGVLFNSARSYEQFLLGLLFPAILHLAMCVAVVGAFGRELRDATIQTWLRESHDRLVPAVLGKIAPYFVLFTVYGAVSLLWLGAIRGGGLAGGFAWLMLAQALMYLAYAVIALLFVAVSRNMASALSAAGLYAGTSLAFSAATFPLQGASWFTRLWSALLPFTAYLKVQAQQLDMGSSLAVSAWPLTALLLFVLVPGIIGIPLLGRASRDPAAWGRR
ncbi:ABC transporter permease [Novilysobacter antarcticus]|uniref:ABC transporter permease n=1 Tax=Novilysobacter antarcticus TaxID=2862543 RepID=UPI001C998B6C|nr:ABC transporter permease [Lysobacter antarcticus]